MRTITRWDPVRELNEFQTRLAPFFGRSVLPSIQDEASELMTSGEWSPLVDIIEDDKEYLIKAELPEIEKTDIKVTLENSVLTLSGIRKAEKEEKGKRFHRIERSYGSFVRSFTLPDNADSEHVEAEFKNGVLHVRVQKSEQAKPKQIAIKVA
jgi:HSP20 family protein